MFHLNAAVPTFAKEDRDAMTASSATHAPATKKRWALEYDAKHTDPDAAVQRVQSGHRVYVHPGCAAPIPLLDALCRRAMVTTRADVRWVVTEYGSVNLFGLNVRQRARALIELAHPEFREEPARAAYERHLL